METEVLEKVEPKFTDETSISFIVPVHAKNLDKSIFKRCLMSLDEQDYDAMEVVIVLNGGDDEVLESVADTFIQKNPNKFKLVKADKSGACYARNLGFENSKGDIVSFFNSDYRAKLGMVRLWVETLINNPDFGFAYGGYEYATSPAYVYGSKPFSEFELDVANYIDCGFPLWRKYFVPWDESVKSLQDWDFWLRVIKTHKIKGYFIPGEPSFIAEKPRPKGLTEDSTNNWVERVKFVKEKNKITLSDLVVTSLGAKNHAVEIAKMLKADFRDDTIFKPNEYKAVYLIGFYVRPDQGNNPHANILASFKPEVKKIIHFVGADIFWLRKFPYDSMRMLAGVMKMGSDHILCENEQAQKELKEFGIDAEIVPIPPYNDYEIKPLPDKFTVSLYLTEKSDFDKYLLQHTLSIVRAMPDIEFTGYGDGAKHFSAPNFKHYGVMPKEEYREYVYKNSAVLRLVRHDTLPMAPCDFMLAGRDAITNVPMEHAYYIHTYGELPMDSWDMFAPGFNDARWPDTKSEIVQMIRNVKKDQLNKEKFDVDRMLAKSHWLDVLDRDEYVKKIYELGGINA